MSDSASVEITIGFDAEFLARILTDAEAAVMRKHREQMLADIQEQWRGWKYKGRNPATTGRSLAGWKANEQTTEGIREILITNDARGYYTGRGYSAYVARSRGATKEWRLVLDNLIKNNLPALEDDLTAAIADSLDTDSPPKRVRQNKTSKYQTVSIEA